MWAKTKQSGFTIVELLIVIVVIGILAAISIAAYSGIQQRARNAQLVAGVNAYQNAILSYVAVNGAYPNAWQACLGANYPAEQCWIGPNGNASVVASMDSALAPFLTPKPTVSTRPLQFTPVDKRQGLVYRYTSPSDIALEYYLEGASQRCLDGTIGAGVIEGTQCIQALPSL